MSFFKKSGLGVYALVSVLAAFAVTALLLYGASGLVLSGYVPETLSKPLAFFAEGAGVLLTAVTAMRLRRRQQPALAGMIGGSMCITLCIAALILHGEAMSRVLWVQPLICTASAALSMGIAMKKKGKKRRSRRK